MKKKSIRMVIFIFVLTLFPLNIFAIDNNEPNNYKSQATYLSFYYGNKNTAYVTSYISYSGDVDWFKIYTYRQAEYSLTLTANNTNEDDLPGNYCVYVYDDQGWLGSSYNSGTQDEQIFFNTRQQNSCIYIKVRGVGGAYNPYTPYKLVIQYGDAVMFREGTRYRDCPEGFFDRESGGTHWHPSGTAYTWGGKDSFAHYKTDMHNCTAIANKPTTSWGDYLSGYSRPGKYSWDTGGHPYWHGIDCSGFVQRCAQAVKINGVQKYKCETFTTEHGHDGNEMHTEDFYYTWRGYTEPVAESDIVTGDIYSHLDHVVMFSRIDLNNIDNSMILEAQGRTLAEGGRIVKENYYYQRKNEGGYVLRRLLRN